MALGLSLQLGTSKRRGSPQHPPGEGDHPSTARRRGSPQPQACSRVCLTPDLGHCLPFSPKSWWQSPTFGASPRLQRAVLRMASITPWDTTLMYHEATPGPFAPWGRQRAGRVSATDPQGSCPPHCSYYPKTVWLTSLLGQGSQYFTLEEGISIQKIIEI